MQKLTEKLGGGAGFTRRDVLRLGTAFGLTLPALLHAETARREARLPGSRAKAVVILFLSGGPSQLDMWDLKPDAPAEVRGSFRPVATNVPGIQVCEHLPRMARVADRYTIVRSMSHEDTNHPSATYWMMTGGRLARPVIQASSMSRNDRPHLGAILAQRLGPRGDVPPFVMVPEFISPVGPARPGQHAGFLGPHFDPYLIAADPSASDYSAGTVRRAATLPVERIQDRRALLEDLEKADGFLAGRAARDLDVYRARAIDLIASTAAQKAFDLSQEPARTRDRYGRHIFGQSVLVARRLIEAGTRLVQVNFVRHDNGKGGQGYDSHGVPPNPPHLAWAKNELLPPTDAAFASLVEDLADRGLLAETLVVMMGEFGRTPRFNKFGGRDHWSRCYSVVLAGGGVPGGRIHGASDAIAALPTRDPVSPDDLAATVYHLLGVDHRMVMHDLQGRPVPLVEGKPVAALL
jgi:uncharacterized protein (DUF1501 family)